MQNVVTFREPKFKPMPGELTAERIREATLPVKVETARRAIAACGDLSELLTWKDKLAALAAAARMAKMPDMARDVNRVHKEAIFRMGELLLQYKTTGASRSRGVPSERYRAAESVGIGYGLVGSVTRVAAAPKAVRERILSDDRIPANATIMARNAPKRLTRAGYKKDSDAAVRIFQGITRLESMTKNGGSQKGLTSIAVNLRAVPLANFCDLTPEENQRAKKLVVEMQEILDAMLQRLGS